MIKLGPAINVKKTSNQIKNLLIIIKYVAQLISFYPGKLRTLLKKYYILFSNQWIKFRKLILSSSSIDKVSSNEGEKTKLKSFNYIFLSSSKA